MAQSPGDQVPGIESNVSVELNDSAAAAISMCTMQSPLQSRKGPSVAQRGEPRIAFVPAASSERPLGDVGTLARLQRALHGDERDPTVESFSSTETLDSISAA